jgi:integrase
MNINDTTEGVYRRCGCTDPATGRRYGKRCPKLADPDHGSWYFALQIPTASDRRERTRRGGYRTAALAAAARNRMLTAAPGHGWTVARWLRRWLTTLPMQVRPSTAAGYRAHVERYLIPLLGQHTLAGLKVRHLEAMFTAIAAHTTRDGRPVTAATLQRIRATLRRALNMAVREQLLHENVARLVVLPRPAHHRPQPWTPARIAAWQHDGNRPVVAVWTPYQLAQFFVSTRHDWLFALWWLAALRGLRRGELCALRWTDVDLDSHTITVSRQLTRANHRLQVAPPKTRAGERTIALDTATTAVLRQYRLQLLASATDADVLEYGLVFCWPDGRPLSPDWLTHHFHHLVTASGLPPVRLHDLRHGAATLAQTAHTDLRIIQDMLGHTSYAFTADTYTTVLPEVAFEAAESTARLILTALCPSA